MYEYSFTDTFTNTFANTCANTFANTFIPALRRPSWTPLAAGIAAWRRSLAACACLLHDLKGIRKRCSQMWTSICQKTIYMKYIKYTKYTNNKEITKITKMQKYHRYFGTNLKNIENETFILLYV